MMMRIRRSHIYLILFLGLLSIGWTLFIRLDETLTNKNSSLKIPPDHHKNVSSKCYGIKKIDCLINNEFTIGCFKTSDETIHVPFNFIRRYFDIYGKIVRTGTGDEFFDWEHSYSKVYYPKETYDYKGTYLWFENYNVEVRDRVKLISGLSGVPISSQWEPRGHFYPIQIAQFGLSHFSKHLTIGKPRATSLINNNKVNATSVSTNGVFVVDGETTTLRLKKKKSRNDLSLSLRVKPMANFSFTVHLQSDPGNLYSISYAASDIDFDEKSFTYGFGEGQRWQNLTREVGVDLSKAYSILDRKLPVKLKNLHISRITFKGKALIEDVILASSAHESHFFAAVRWLMDNQDDAGGWPIKTTRKLSNGALVLNPGWYSAMAQGQAISLLTRMYHHVGDEVYLKAATRALGLFNVTSQNGGFKTYFLDKYPWFEEYPTVPSSFVLNGFIYSLFGLYDLKMSCRKTCPLADEYFSLGIESLKQLLSLFDTGSGTLYDLRHFTLQSEPKIARWDYHTTHINQLLYLNTVLHNNQYLSTVAKRWISYMKGKRAAHN